MSATPSAASSAFITKSVASQNGSVNVVQLLKSVQELTSISQAREELERYYIKNFTSIKGFFQAAYSEANTTKITSTIVSE